MSVCHRGKWTIVIWEAERGKQSTDVSFKSQNTQKAPSFRFPNLLIYIKYKDVASVANFLIVRINDRCHYLA